MWSAEHVAHNCTNDWNAAPAAGDPPCPAASRLAESATPRPAASGHQSAVSSANASQVPSSCPCCFGSDSSPHPSSAGPSINTSKSGLTSGAGFSSGLLVLWDAALGGPPSSSTAPSALDAHGFLTAPAAPAGQSVPNPPFSSSPASSLVSGSNLVNVVLMKGAKEALLMIYVIVVRAKMALLMIVC